MGGRGETRRDSDGETLWSKGAREVAREEIDRPSTARFAHHTRARSSFLHALRVFHVTLSDPPSCTTRSLLNTMLCYFLFRYTVDWNVSSCLILPMVSRSDDSLDKFGDFKGIFRHAVESLD